MYIKQKHRKYIKTSVQIIVLGIALWVLGPQLQDLVTNRQVIKSLYVSWLLLGLVIFFLSFFFSALVYQLLSPKKLSYKKNVLTQLATAFTNRLLPSGVGGISTNSMFLIRSGYKKPTAVSLAMTNNIVGFLAFCIVVITSGTVSKKFIVNIVDNLSAYLPWILAVCILLITVAVASSKIRLIIKNNALQVFALIKGVIGAPHRFALALIFSCFITLSYASALYCCLRAAGIILSPSELMLVFSASAVAVTVSPTPNGLGAAEASMLIALEAISFDGSSALAAIIAFRLISFWIPIAPGYVFFRYIVSKRII